MADSFGRDCNRPTNTVCSECGLVLEAHYIDPTSEWRTFAKESNDNDHVRVGGPSNPFLADGGLSAVISGDLLSSSLGRWHTRGANCDGYLIEAFKDIATTAHRLL